MKEQRLELFYVDGKVSHANLPIDFRDDIKGLIGPSHVSWRKKVDFSEPVSYLSQKAQKKILKAIDYAKKTLGYTFELAESLNEKDYLEWLVVYNKSMFEKGMEVVKLTPRWFKSNPKAKNYGAVFVRNKHGLIMGGVLIEKGVNQISCSYRAHEHMHIKDSSLSAIIEYYIDQFALQLKVDLIVRGVDSNIYGIRLSKGLSDFKAYYGFKPTPMDYSGSYFPRKLVFFQPYPEIVTYEYADESTSEIIKKTYLEENIRKYLYNFDVLQIL